MLVTLTTLFPFFMQMESDIKGFLFLNRAKAIGKGLLFSAQAYRGIDMDIIGYSSDDPYVNRTGEHPKQGFVFMVEGGSKLRSVQSPIYTQGGVPVD